jgi:2-dehydro-3-deoxyphosphogluconate aldolase/(4S)-4-hydroxy-2-oxoglutarate aldolase
MDSSTLMQKMHGIGIIPTVVLNHVENAVPLARALCAGGIPAAEVTYRTSAAHDAMKAMKEACPQMIVGAGTVLTKEQVDSALDAGAEFIVSPGLNPDIVKYCQSRNVTVIPGLATASEIEQALSLGLHTVKFFPAEQLGGIKTIKALCGPYRNVTFMPTGGINPDNMLDYLNDPKIFAVGGTWMVKASLIEAGQFDKITEISRQAVLKMLGMHVAHVGLNCPDEETGRRVAEQYAALFQGQVRQTAKGFFGSDLVEVMVSPHEKGTHGHIGIGVHSVERAVAYFESQGFQFDESTISRTEDGAIKFAYFADEIGGFRIHLVQG